MPRQDVEQILEQEYMDQYVNLFSRKFIRKAFSGVKASAAKVLDRLNVPATDANIVKLLKAVSRAVELGQDWEPPPALVQVAETRARIQYNELVKKCLDDLKVS